MKIQIESIENGYLIEWNEEMDDGKIEKRKLAIVEEEQNDCLKKLLYEVAEHTGYNYDKYSKFNLNITFDLKGKKL